MAEVQRYQHHRIGLRERAQRRKGKLRGKCLLPSIRPKGRPSASRIRWPEAPLQVIQRIRLLERPLFFLPEPLAAQLHQHLKPPDVLRHLTIQDELLRD